MPVQTRFLKIAPLVLSCIGGGWKLDWAGDPREYPVVKTLTTFFQTGNETQPVHWVQRMEYRSGNCL